MDLWSLLPQFFRDLGTEDCDNCSVCEPEYCCEFHSKIFQDDTAEQLQHTQVLQETSGISGESRLQTTPTLTAKPQSGGTVDEEPQEQKSPAGDLPSELSSTLPASSDPKKSKISSEQFVSRVKQEESVTLSALQTTTGVRASHVTLSLHEQRYEGKRGQLPNTEASSLLTEHRDQTSGTSKPQEESGEQKTAILEQFNQVSNTDPPNETRDRGAPASTDAQLTSQQELRASSTQNVESSMGSAQTQNMGTVFKTETRIQEISATISEKISSTCAADTEKSKFNGEDEDRQPAATSSQERQVDKAVSARLYLEDVLSNDDFDDVHLIENQAKTKSVSNSSVPVTQSKSSITLSTLKTLRRSRSLTKHKVKRLSKTRSRRSISAGASSDEDKESGESTSSYVSASEKVSQLEFLKCEETVHIDDKSKPENMQERIRQITARSKLLQTDNIMAKSKQLSRKARSKSRNGPMKVTVDIPSLLPIMTEKDTTAKLTKISQRAANNLLSYRPTQ